MAIKKATIRVQKQMTNLQQGTFKVKPISIRLSANVASKLMKNIRI